MTTLIPVVAFIAWVIGPCNIAGYWVSRLTSSRHLPWNWRILLGPVVYLKWLDKKK